MKEDFKHSDQNVREKMEGMRMAPPEGAWAGIQSEITTGRSNKRGFFIWFIVLSFLSVTTTGALIFMNTEDGAASKNSLAINDGNTNSVTKLNETDKNSNLEIKDASREKTTESGEGSAEFTQIEQENSLAHDRIHSGVQKQQKRKNTFGSDSNAGFADRNESYVLGKRGSIDGNDKNNTASPDKTKESSKGEIPSKIDFNIQAETVKTNSKIDFNSNKMTFSNVSFLSPLELTPLEENIYASKANNNFNKVKIRRGGLSAEFGFGGSSFRYSAKNTASPGLSQYLKDAQSAEFGLNGFVRMNYHLNSWFSVHSGVEVQQQNHTVQFDQTSTSSYWTADTVGYYFDSITQQQVPLIDSNYITETTVNPQQFSNRETFISIPFGVMVDFPVGIRSEIGVNVSGILGIRTKASGSVLTDENNNSIPIETAYKSNGNLSMRLSLRYSYALTEKNSVYFEPYIGFGLNNRSTPSLPYDTRFWIRS